MSELRDDRAAFAAPPLPIFEVSTSRLYRSNDGGLAVLPIQYGIGAKPTFEVRHDGDAVMCTNDPTIADAYVAGYDLAAQAVRTLLDAWPVPADSDAAVLARATLDRGDSVEAAAHALRVEWPAMAPATIRAAIESAERARGASSVDGARVDQSRRYLEGDTVDPACTGYIDEAGYLAHDGDTCPVHEAGLDIGDGDPGDEKPRLFEIVVGRSGDRAAADTPEAALLAAATLIDDARQGIQGDVRALRASVYITENGTYAGILTAFARQGVRRI